MTETAVPQRECWMWPHCARKSLIDVTLDLIRRLAYAGMPTEECCHGTKHKRVVERGLPSGAG
jgi:hypothetical protein